MRSARWKVAGVLALSSMVLPYPAAAAPSAPLWVSTYEGPGHWVDDAQAIGLSPDGSKVFVTGSSTGLHNDEYATIAYDAASGNVIWGRRFKRTGQGNNQASELAVSPDGSSVYVSGWSPLTGGTGSGDFGTVAYDAATGGLRWSAFYGSTGDDFPHAMALSPDGSTLVVTGDTFTSHGPDFAAVAYDTVTGAKRWDGTYNGPGDWEDSGEAVAFSSDGATVYVAGSSFGSGTFLDYAVVAYDAATGTQRWVGRYDGVGHGDDGAVGLAAAPDGATVFVTGWMYSPGGDADISTLALDAANGAARWRVRSDGPVHGSDVAAAIGLTPDGTTLIVTGRTQGQTDIRDIVTIAYAAASGAVRWVTRYNGPGAVTDQAVALAISLDGRRVFVTGESGNEPAEDYATAGYDVATGALVFGARYDAGSLDVARGVATAADGSSVYVTGISSEHYATIAYPVT